MKRRAVTIVGAVLAVAALAGAGAAYRLAGPATRLPADHVPAPNAAALAPAVTVVPAVEREIAQRLAISGTLVPRDEITVMPEIEGHRVTELLVEEGAHVERGQVLARLTHDLIDLQIAEQNAIVAKARAIVPQNQNNIEQADAAALEARQALDRARQLQQSGNATAAVMEARTSAARQADGRASFARNGLAVAKAELAQAEAVRDELQLRLARTAVRAPEAGIVSRRAARVGMMASLTGEPLFRLIARGEIELEGEIVGATLASLHEGAPASIEIGDGDHVSGSIRDIYPEVDRATRLGKVRIRLAPDPRLRIGAFARGVVEQDRVRGTVVPQAAIIHDGGRRSSVLVARGDVLESRPVRTGLTDDNDVEVVSGLRAGERVVARAGSFLRGGDRIRPIPVEPSTPSAADSAPRETAAAVAP